MQVTIEVPDDIAEQMRQANGQDVARHIVEAYALWAYQAGEIGGGQLRRLLGFDTRDEVDQFLADHNATHNYTLADLEAIRKPFRLVAERSRRILAVMKCRAITGGEPVQHKMYVTDLSHSRTGFYTTLIVLTVPAIPTMPGVCPLYAPAFR